MKKNVLVSLVAEVVEDLDKIATIIEAAADRMEDVDQVTCALLKIALRGLVEDINELEQITGA